MEFFTSPTDLKGWVKSQESAETAAKFIVNVIGKGEENDVVETCKSIYDGAENSDQASDVLFSVLAKHNLVAMKKIAADNKMKKESQIMRQPGEYDFPLRVCPKLTDSIGHRRISEYNCIHYCEAGMVFDDDPKRVYCAEAIWRRHIMDKFSREFKDKDGKWVGGYINERFQVFHHDGPTMQLGNNERTRQPKPHEYSTERRLEEARGVKTKSIMATDSKPIKMGATVETEDASDNIYQIFNDILEMKEAKIDDQDILLKISEHYDIDLYKTMSLYKKATEKMTKNANKVYSFSVGSNFPEKSTLLNTRDVSVVIPGKNEMFSLKAGTPVVYEMANSQGVFQITDGPNTGAKFVLANKADSDAFVNMDHDDESIQKGAEETGLLDDSPVAPATLTETSQK